MHFDNSPCERESDAQSRLRTMRGALTLREQFEHARQHLARDSDPAIRDAEHDLVAASAICHNVARNEDLPSRSREFRRIVQEI
jgi:hypothetical protein